MNQATAVPSQTVVRAVRHLKIPPSSVMRPGIFPFEPVFDLLSPDDTLRKCNGARLDGVIAGIATRLDVDRQYVYRWLRRGLDDRQADVVAIMLGLHPCLIWGDWFAHAPDVEDIVQPVVVEKPWVPVEIFKPPAPEVIPPKLNIRNLDKRVDRLVELGFSWRAIARDLKEAGFTNWRSGQPWKPDDLRLSYRDGRIGMGVSA
jgi:hypothetical protein